MTMVTERELDLFDSSNTWTHLPFANVLERQVEIVESQDSCDVMFEAGSDERYGPEGTIRNAIKAAIREKNVKEATGKDKE